jgi:hypothetical protein
MTEMWDVEEAGAVAEAVFGMQMTFEVAFTSPVPGASAPVPVSVASAPVNNAALTTPKKAKKEASAFDRKFNSQTCICGDQRCRSLQKRYKTLVLTDPSYHHRLGYKALSTVDILREATLAHLGEAARSKAAKVKEASIAWTHFHPELSAGRSPDKKSGAKYVSKAQGARLGFANSAISNKIESAKEKKEGGDMQYYITVPNYPLQSVEQDLAEAEANGVEEE